MKKVMKRILLGLSATVLILGGMLGLAAPAQASAPIVLSGSSWFGGAGVNVCSGSTDPQCGTETHVGGWSGDWWQCVELAQRFYKKMGWYNGIFSGVDYAYQIYNNASGLGMTRQPNGSITSIVRGDMIIHASSDPGSGGAGHVAIVDSINGSSVSVVEQNGPTSTGRASYTWSGGSLTRGSAPILGIVHASSNQTSPNGVTVTSAVAPRIGVLQTNGHFLVKEGGLDATWSDQLDSVKIGQVDGNRIGVVQTNNHLLVKEDGLSASWVDVMDNVQNFAISGGRIAALQTNGHLLVKEGSLSASWNDVLDNIASFSISGNRIGVVQTNGHFLVKEGALNNPWSDILDNVSAVSVQDGRVGALQTNGHFLVKEGALNTTWSDQLDNVLIGYLSGNRIGVLQTNGHFLVKEGGLSSSWNDIQSSVRSVSMSGNRIGVLQTNGHFLIKEGSITSPWTDVQDSVLSGSISVP